MNDTGRRILQLEARDLRAKEAEISALGLRPARYYQRLTHLVTQPDVVAEFPQLARRVQERTRRNMRGRASRVVGR